MRMQKPSRSERTFDAGPFVTAASVASMARKKTRWELVAPTSLIDSLNLDD
jgi:hypothetical protein